MDHENIDRIIEEALMEGTKDAVNLKDKIWNNLEGTISLGNRAYADKNKPHRKWIKISAAAAGVAIIFFFGTIPGKAAVNKIKETLAPQKKIVQQIEGEQESSVQNLKESSIGYYMYIDESILELQHEPDRDIILPKNKPADASLPKIFMEIRQVKDKTPDQLIHGINDELKSKFKTIQGAETVKQPLSSIKLTAATGTKWNDAKVTYYLVDNGHGGTFIIKTQIFLEASEGFGVRFENMLKEFRVIEDKK